LLIRYLSAMGIRVMDLFRIFDRDARMCVTRHKFIQGLKRVRAPLTEEEMTQVARRMQLNKRGLISYQELATTVRNQIKETRAQLKKEELLEKKKKEERRRILMSDDPLRGPVNLNYLPTLYSMYSARRERTGQSVSPFYGTFSRRGSNFTPLPSIRGNSSPWRSPHRSPNRSPTRRSPQRPTPMTLVREMSLPPVPSKSRPESVVEKKEKEIGSKSPSDYEKILRRNKTSIELYAQSKYI